MSYFRLGYPRVAIKELDPEEIPGSRTPTDVSIIVQVDVTEGPNVRVGEVTFTGNQPKFEARLRGLMRSQPGGLYVVEQLLHDKADLEAFYRNLGFESVQVGIKPVFDEEVRTATIGVTVTEGPQIEIGEIQIIGNRSVSEKAIKEQLVFKEGQPFGEAAQVESRRKLLAMGVFRMVTIEEEPRPSGETLAHVTVSVEELPATLITYGGGVEGGRRPLQNAAGQFEDRDVVAPRGFFEIGRRNLWGKNRSVDVFTRISPQLATTTTGNFGFVEYRVSGTYREPNAFDSETDALVGVTSEQAARTGFNYARKSANLQFNRHTTSHLGLSGRYELEYTRIFDFDASSFTPEDEITIDKLFPQVRLSILSGECRLGPARRSRRPDARDARKRGRGVLCQTSRLGGGLQQGLPAGLRIPHAEVEATRRAGRSRGDWPGAGIRPPEGRSGHRPGGDDRRPPGQPALLCRRQHHRARLSARSTRRARDSDRRWPLDRRQWRGGAERRGADDDPRNCSVATSA